MSDLLNRLKHDTFDQDQNVFRVAFTHAENLLPIIKWMFPYLTDDFISAAPGKATWRTSELCPFSCFLAFVVWESQIAGDDNKQKSLQVLLNGKPMALRLPGLNMDEETFEVTLDDHFFNAMSLQYIPKIQVKDDEEL